jgi:hypothetical protein
VVAGRNPGRHATGRLGQRPIKAAAVVGWQPSGLFRHAVLGGMGWWAGGAGSARDGQRRWRRGVTARADGVMATHQGVVMSRGQGGVLRRTGRGRGAGRRKKKWRGEERREKRKKRKKGGEKRK